MCGSVATHMVHHARDITNLATCQYFLSSLRIVQCGLRSPPKPRLGHCCCIVNAMCKSVAKGDNIHEQRRIDDTDHECMCWVTIAATIAPNHILYDQLRLKKAELSLLV